MEKMKDAVAEMLKASAVYHNSLNEKIKEVELRERKVEKIEEKLQKREVMITIKETSLPNASEEKLAQAEQLLKKKDLEIISLKIENGQKTQETAKMKIQIEKLESTLSDRQLQLDLTRKELAEIKLTTTNEPNGSESSSKRKELPSSELVSSSKKLKESKSMSELLEGLVIEGYKREDNPLLLAKVFKYSRKSRIAHQKHCKTVFNRLNANDKYQSMIQQALKVDGGRQLNLFKHFVFNAENQILVYDETFVVEMKEHLRKIQQSLIRSNCILGTLLGLREMFTILDEGLSTAPKLNVPGQKTRHNSVRQI